MTRSFLFVPADSERKIRKAASAGADALIYDLEDSVNKSQRATARKIAAAACGRQGDAWIRINPLHTEDADLDLEAVVPARPAGIVLPKPESATDIEDLATRLDKLEAEHGIAAGSLRIIALCTERPAALFSLGAYVGATPRLAGLSWGAEDLSTAVGATSTRDDSGNWLPPYELARSLCLFAAAAAGVQAIDTVVTDFRNEEGVQRYALKAKRDGFTGMLAIHPAQVAIINRAFMPTAAELEHARRIVALFEENPDAGTLGMDGRMVDRPHLTKARQLIARAEAGGKFDA